MGYRELSAIFADIARILEIRGENPFRVRAYDRAASLVDSLGDELDRYVNESTLTTLKGIGADLSAKIKEFYDSGSLELYEKLKRETPPGVLEMLTIPGVGPKTVKILYNERGIDSVDKLQESLESGSLDDLSGMKEKTRANILKGIELRKRAAKVKTIDLMLPVAEYFKEKLSKASEITALEIAGSLRRRKPFIKDIDLLAASRRPEKTIERFVNIPGVKEIIARGSTKCSILTDDDIQVDLRVVAPSNFAPALLYFTGSKEFNVRLRQLAIKRNRRLNEYGLYAGDQDLSGKESEFKREADFFAFFGMPFIDPVLREDRGEIEAAANGILPVLIRPEQIRGDLHVHSTYSDGVNSLAELAAAGQESGYAYIAVCDHSPSLKVANGLSVSDARRKIEEVRRLNRTMKPFTILCGTEVDIDSEGGLDYPDDLLKEFDIVIAAVHTGLKQPRSQITGRIVSACRNRRVNIIAHPRGIMPGYRPAYDVDFDEILDAARENNVALEINCNPHRFDCDDIHALRAKRRGVKLSIGTDSHRLDQFAFMSLGVYLGQRAWLETSDVINCMSLPDIRRWLKK